MLILKQYRKFIIVGAVVLILLFFSSFYMVHTNTNPPPSRSPMPTPLPQQTRVEDYFWSVDRHTSTVSSDGTMFRANNARTGVYDDDGGKTPTGTLLWKISIPTNESHESPVIANNTVCIEGDEGNLHAFGAKTGVYLWNSTNLTAAGIRPHNPAIADGSIYWIKAYHQNKDAFVVPALDATTGAELWSWDHGSAGNTISSPAVYDGIIYSVGMGLSWAVDDIVAMDAKTGEVLGVTGPIGNTRSDLAIANGTIYIGSYGSEHTRSYYGTMYAINISTGKQTWEFPPRIYNVAYSTPQPTMDIGPIYSSPAVSQGVVYFGSEDGNLYALNATAGSLLWNFTTAGPIYSSPAVSQGVVYFGSEDGNLYAVG